MAAETPILPAHIEETIQAIAKLHSDHHREAGPVQGVVERLTGWIGRPGFIAGMTIAIILWVVGNLISMLSGAPAWDEPPFAWLQDRAGRSGATAPAAPLARRGNR
jgi:uncharacterized membrane protein